MKMTYGTIESNSEVKPATRENYDNLDNFRSFFQETFYQGKNGHNESDLESDLEKSITSNEDVDFGIKPASLRLRVYTKEQIKHELNRYQRPKISSLSGRGKFS